MMEDVIEERAVTTAKVAKAATYVWGWKVMIVIFGAILALLMLLGWTVINLILYTGNQSSLDPYLGVPAGLKTIYEEIGKKYDIPWNVLAAIHRLDPSYSMDALSGQPVDGKYAEIFNQAGMKYGVDPALLKAIAKQESSFNPDTVSKAGARGLMQLMPDTCRKNGLDPNSDCLNPQKNVMAGANEIAGYLNDYNGNLQLALAAYNAGPGNVKKYKGIPPFKETQNYVKKVSSYYEQFKNEPASSGGNSLNQVRQKLISIAENLKKYRAEHESKSTSCMSSLKEKEGVGSLGALSCAIYSYRNSWDFVAQVEAQAQSLEAPAGAFTFQGGKFIWPASGRKTGEFGEDRGDHVHGGIDIAAPSGSPIYAAADGVVTRSKSNPGGFGWYVVIDHGNGLETWYGHMYKETVKVKVGQRVARGQKIAEIGNNGRSSGPHLHFEVHENGKRKDPMSWLR